MSLIVCYHYVRNNSNCEYKLNSCSIDDFKRQLDFLSKNYELVSIYELLNRRKNKENSDNSCTVTFDDSIIDHYNILGILLEKKIIATFFPITCVFKKIVPITHKTHIILSKINIEDLVVSLEKYLSSNYDEYKNFTFPRKNRINQKRLLDDLLTANFKQIIAELPINIKKDFIELKFAEVIDDEEEFCNKFFLSPEHLKAMHESGMIIGSHTCNHYSLKHLSFRKQEDEIINSKKEVEKIIDNKIDIFSYPFGDYNEDTIKILKDNGFRAGVLFNHKKLSDNDQDLLLSAFDVTDVFN